MRKLALVAALIALAAPCSAAQAAEEYQYPCPEKVRIIVPFPAGAATDMQIRFVAKYLESQMRRTIVVENMAGADGAIAASYVASAKPDGCTLMTLTNGLFGVDPMSGGTIRMPKLWKFVPISMLAENMLLFIVNQTNPAHTVPEFVENAKGHTTTYGTGNTSAYVSGALFAALSGVPLQRIPYKGEVGMKTDVLSGQVSSAFALTALGQVKGGGLRALAVMSDRRFPGLPNVPAITEMYPAFQDIVLIAPHGTLVGPPGFPKDVAAWISREVNAILARPDVIAGFEAIGSKAVGSTPDELADYFRQQAEEWPRIVRQYKIETPAQ